MSYSPFEDDAKYHRPHFYIQRWYNQFNKYIRICIKSCKVFYKKNSCIISYSYIFKPQVMLMRHVLHLSNGASICASK